MDKVESRAEELPTLILHELAVLANEKAKGSENFVMDWTERNKKRLLEIIAEDPGVLVRYGTDKEKTLEELSLRFE